MYVQWISFSDGISTFIWLVKSRQAFSSLLVDSLHLFRVVPHEHEPHAGLGARVGSLAFLLVFLGRFAP